EAAVAPTSALVADAAGVTAGSGWSAPVRSPAASSVQHAAAPAGLESTASGEYRPQQSAGPRTADAAKPVPRITTEARIRTLIDDRPHSASSSPARAVAGGPPRPAEPGPAATRRHRGRGW